MRSWIVYKLHQRNPRTPKNDGQKAVVMDHLLAYGDSDEEDEQTEVQQRLKEESLPSASMASSPAGEVQAEPEPPKRPSDEDSKSETSADEETIIKDGMDALRTEEQQLTPNVELGGGATPRSTSAGTGVVEVPPSPPGDCDPKLKAKFERFFELKAAGGAGMNERITNNKSFKNPAIYEFLVNTYAIDEKGTNFPEHIFNPKRFRREDFYDHFRKLDQQASERHEKRKKEQERVVAEATAAVAAVAKKQKAARFEAAK